MKKSLLVFILGILGFGFGLADMIDACTVSSYQTIENEKFYDLSGNIVNRVKFRNYNNLNLIKNNIENSEACHYLGGNISCGVCWKDGKQINLRNLNSFTYHYFYFNKNFLIELTIFLVSLGFSILNIIYLVLIKKKKFKIVFFILTLIQSLISFTIIYLVLNLIGEIDYNKLKIQNETYQNREKYKDDEWYNKLEKNCVEKGGKLERHQIECPGIGYFD